MSRPAAFKQSDLTRAGKGLIAAGLKPSGCRIDPATGEIQFSFGEEQNPTRPNPLDRLFEK